MPDDEQTDDNETIEAAWNNMRANVLDQLNLSEDTMYYARHCFFAGSWMTMRRITAAIQSAKDIKTFNDNLTESLWDVEAEFRKYHNTLNRSKE